MTNRDRARYRGPQEAHGTAARRPAGWVRWGTLTAGLLIASGLSAPGASDEFDRIREKAAEMVGTVNRARAEFHTEGKPSELNKAYGGFSYLLTKTKIEQMNSLVCEPADEATKAAREHTARVIHVYAIGAQVAPVQDNSRNSLRDKTMVVGDATLALHDLDHRLLMQVDRDKRLAWWMGAGQLYKTVTIYLRNLMVDRDTRSKELGYDGYYPLLQTVEAWDLPTISSTADRLLEETSASFTAQLETLSQAELGMELRKMRTYDAGYIFSFPSLSKRAGKIDAAAIAANTFKACGLQLDKQRTLKVDVREKRGRLPEASAWEIQSGRAEVSMIPTGRLSDLPSLLGAIGEAQFYYHVPGSLPFEDAYIGNNILPATYRALFEMIAEEPAWVARHLKLKDATPEEVAAAFRLRRLYLAREAAGRFLFQLQLHENTQIDPGTYTGIMERALAWKRIPNDGDLFLMANDDYRSGGRLLGYVMAAQIREALVAQWGPEWFADARLGEKVVAGAAKGHTMGLEEFLGLWGVTALDPGVMAGQLAQR